MQAVDPYTYECTDNVTHASTKKVTKTVSITGNSLLRYVTSKYGITTLYNQSVFTVDVS